METGLGARGGRGRAGRSRDTRPGRGPSGRSGARSGVESRASERPGPRPGDHRLEPGEPAGRDLAARPSPGAPRAGPSAVPERDSSGGTRAGASAPPRGFDPQASVLTNLPPPPPPRTRRDVAHTLGRPSRLRPSHNTVKPILPRPPRFCFFVFGDRVANHTLPSPNSLFYSWPVNSSLYLSTLGVGAGGAFVILEKC